MDIVIKLWFWDVWSQLGYVRKQKRINRIEHPMFYGLTPHSRWINQSVKNSAAEGAIEDFVGTKCV